MARPRKNSPEQVTKAIDQCIADFEQSGDIKALTDFHLLQVLGNISIHTLENYYDGTADKAYLEEQEKIADKTGEDSIKTGYCEALKKLVEYRRITCIQHIATDRVSSGWIFLSKQPHWGGFQDVQRVENKGQQSINIQISGPDGKALKE